MSEETNTDIMEAEAPVAKGKATDAKVDVAPEVPGPTGGQAVAPGGSGEAQDPMPKTKQSLMASMVANMTGKTRKELAAMHSAMTNAKVVTEAEDKEDDDEDMEKDDDSKETEKKVPPFFKKEAKCKKEDVDFSNLTAIFASDETLSEEFKSSATTLFEAAIMDAINSKLAVLAEQMEEAFNAEVESLTEELSSKVDQHVSHAVNSWVKENELAIERGIKAELVEDFMSGLKKLFTEHYIDIPDEKISVVEEMAEKIETLESQLSEEIKSSIAIKEEMDAMKKTAIISENTKEMTVVDSEKFVSLAEAIEFVSVEDFVGKMKTIKETYFPATPAAEVPAIQETDFVELKEETVVPKEPRLAGNMASYVTALGKTVKK